MKHYSDSETSRTWSSRISIINHKVHETVNEPYYTTQYSLLHVSPRHTPHTPHYPYTHFTSYPALIPFPSLHLADLHPISAPFTSLRLSLFNSCTWKYSISSVLQSPFTSLNTFLTLSLYILDFPALQNLFTSLITFQPLFLEIRDFLLTSNSLHFTYCFPNPLPKGTRCDTGG